MSDESKTVEDRAATYLAALRQHPHEAGFLYPVIAHALAVLTPLIRGPGVVSYTVRLEDGSEQTYVLKDDGA